MDKRRHELSQLHSYIKGVDKEVTMILQSLQWDRKHIEESIPLVACKYDAGHKIPADKRELHEGDCFLKCQGYAKENQLLPELLDPNAATVVKLSMEEIQVLINKAAQTDPMFKRGPGSEGWFPLSADRLLCTYSADERRALSDAVVSAAPETDYLDLALPSTGKDGETRRKTKLELLAELRDMKRRRTRYRGAAPARNYSHELRDLIRTQMEIYTGVPSDTITPSNNTSHQSEFKDKHFNNYANSSKIEEINVEKDRKFRAEDRVEGNRSKYIERSDIKDKRRDEGYKGKERHHHKGSSEREKYSRDRENDYESKSKHKYRDVNEDSDRRGTSLHKDKHFEKHRTKHKEERPDRYTEYESRTHLKREHDTKSERRYIKHQDEAGSSSAKRRHRERIELSSEKTYEERKHCKRYYDIKREEELPYENVKRKKQK